MTWEFSRSEPLGQDRGRKDSRTGFEKARGGSGGCCGVVEVLVSIVLEWSDGGGGGSKRPGIGSSNERGGFRQGVHG